MGLWRGGGGDVGMTENKEEKMSFSLQSDGLSISRLGRVEWRENVNWDEQTGFVVINAIDMVFLPFLHPPASQFKMILLLS